MLVQKSVDLLYDFQKSKVNNITKNLTKLEHQNFQILGCLPPYFESYYDGIIDKDFISFYEILVEIMSGKVDYFLLETQVSILHIRKILEIIHNHSLRNRRKPPSVMVSIYPQGNISGREIKQLVIDYSFMLDAILVNCGSLPKIREYFTREIEAIDLARLKVKFGFYCNKIDEQGYKNYSGDKKNKVKITDFYEETPIPGEEIDKFRNYLDWRGYDIIIGGCCGYGMQEMEELINQIKYRLVKGTARL
jgi:methionine synthase I (cobalamin-dependent)